ncbi:zonular occludens toxin domain-containing protein [Aeromonas veronii]
MPVWAVTGKTGQGKGLISMALIADYLSSGKTVATNMDIYPEHFKNPYNDKTRIIRLPDHPTADDLMALGAGAPDGSVDEDDFGLLMLDEGATWLNSRDWNSPGRREFNDWLVQRRKYLWNVAIQIQSLESMDAQARRSVISHEMRAVKINTVHIPIISGVIKELTGKRYPQFPKWMRYHKATTTNLETGHTEDITRYRGADLYKLYDTLQTFSPNYPHGTFTYLTPWHLVGRYMKPKRGIKFWLRQMLRLPLYAAVALSCATSKECRKYFLNADN